MNRQAHKSTTTGIAFGLFAALIWGTWPALSRLAIQQSLTPLDMAALRFAVAGPILLPLVWRRGIAAIGWRGALLLTCGAGAPYILLVIWGLQFAPAAHFGVITPSTMLISSTLGSWVFLGDRPTRTRVIGIVVILTGVALIGWQALPNLQDRAWIGDIMFVGGGMLWAAYTVGSRFFKADPFHAIAIVAVFSMILFIPLYAVLVGPLIFAAPPAELLFQGIFQGILVSIVALYLFTRAVAILGAGKGALFGALIPGLTVLVAFPVLGEVPTGREMLGVVTVTGGMLLALGVFRRRRTLNRA